MQRDLMQLWFSFEGRITRADFWWAHVMAFIGFAGAVLVAVGLISGGQALDIEPISRIMGGILIFGSVIAMTWSSYALAIKRLHDQDLSGWWILVSAIPYLGPFCLFIALGFFRGTYGPNRFGEENPA